MPLSLSCPPGPNNPLAGVVATAGATSPFLELPKSPAVPPRSQIDEGVGDMGKSPVKAVALNSNGNGEEVGLLYGLGCHDIGLRAC